MQLDFGFFVTNILLGAGLAMDAFSVSVVNGLNEPCMRRKKMLLIAGIFALFQFAMPAIGWLCVSTIADLFDAFSKFIPWIAFTLLAYIGTNSILEQYIVDKMPLYGLVTDKGELVTEPIYTDISFLDYQEADRADLDTAAYTASEGILGILGGKVAATAAKAHADLGHGDDGDTVRGGDGGSHHSVHIHHFTNLLDGGFQHIGKFLAHLTAPPFLLFRNTINSFSPRQA